MRLGKNDRLLARKCQGNVSVLTVKVGTRDVIVTDTFGKEGKPTFLIATVRQELYECFPTFSDLHQSWKKSLSLSFTDKETQGRTQGNLIVVSDAQIPKQDKLS